MSGTAATAVTPGSGGGPELGPTALISPGDGHLPGV